MDEIWDDTNDICYRSIQLCLDLQGKYWMVIDSYGVPTEIELDKEALKDLRDAIDRTLSTPKKSL